MLGHCLRRWHNIKPPLGWRLVWYENEWQFHSRSSSISTVCFTRSWALPFLNLLGRCLNFFSKIFYRIILSSDPNFPENFVEFCCILRNLDHLAYNIFLKSQFPFHHYRETIFFLQANWSSLQNTQQNSTKLSAMLGEDEKMIAWVN